MGRGRKIKGDEVEEPEKKGKGADEQVRAPKRETRSRTGRKNTPEKPNNAKKEKGAAISKSPVKAQSKKSGVKKQGNADPSPESGDHTAKNPKEPRMDAESAPKGRKNTKSV